MSKKSLLFIDHVFHKKTRSFDFIKKILSEQFEISELFVDPSRPVRTNFTNVDAEYVVLAQVDFLTHVFVALGKKVVVIQMYDGSAALPDDHWRLNRQARYLNFSQTLHAKALGLGCESLLLKFAPNPSNYKYQTDFDELRLFFWNRLPGSSINCARIGKMLAGQLASCHIHLPRDDGLKPSEDVSSFFDCHVTTSEWFESRPEFDAALDSCNIFVAPRMTEGIGHSFLEAMARGMIVLAGDMPTHNEYISTWYNGILFHPQTAEIDLRSGPALNLMGAQARFSMERDYIEWEESKHKICEFVLSCSPAVVPKSTRLEFDLRNLIPAYQEGIDVYRKALNDSKFCVEVFEKWRDYESSDSHDVTHRAPKDDLYLFMGLSKSMGVELEGFSLAEGTHIWSNALESAIRIPIHMLPVEKKDLCVTIEMAAVKNMKAEVLLNGKTLGKVLLTSDDSKHVFHLPPDDEFDDNFELKIAVEQLLRPGNGDFRDLGCRINYLIVHRGSFLEFDAVKHNSNFVVTKLSKLFRKNFST